MFQDKNRRFTPSRLKKQYKSPKQSIKERVVKDAEMYLSADEFEEFMKFAYEFDLKEPIEFISFDFMLCGRINAPKFAWSLHDGKYYAGIFGDEFYIYEECKSKRECFDWIAENSKTLAVNLDAEKTDLF